MTALLAILNELAEEKPNDEEYCQSIEFRDNGELDAAIAD
jgi:hypothetical protein